MYNRFIATVVFLSFLIASCDNPTPPATPVADSTAGRPTDTTQSVSDSREERNRKTALASIEALNRHDIAGTLKDADASMLDYADGSSRPMPADSVRFFMSNMFDAFPDYKAENMKIVADGEWVMVWADWTGTWKKDFMGQKASGKPFRVRDVDIFRFNTNGKITEHHNIQPFASIASQVGLRMQ